MYIIGTIIGKHKHKEAAVVGACEFCSVIARTVQCSNEIHIQRGIWQKWKDFNDHFDYYIYRVKLHSVICIQRHDTQASLAIDLVVNSTTSTWNIRVREAEWKPGKWNVFKSQHTWHATAALKAIKNFSVNDFKQWSICANNCSTFVHGIVGFMKDSTKRAECECKQITDDFDKLSSFGADLGLELMYMTSQEVVQPIPRQEEGEEEPQENFHFQCDQHRNDGFIPKWDEGGPVKSGDKNSENRGKVRFDAKGQAQEIDNRLAMNMIEKQNNQD